MKAVVATFNQEKALVGVVKTGCETDGWNTTQHYSRLYEDGHKDGRIPGPWLWNGYHGGYKRVELYVKCDN